jgi:hypothetical protein
MPFTHAALPQLAAVAAGAAAFALSVLAWEFFRGSPFGNLVAFLPVLVAATTLLGVVSIVAPETGTLVEFVEAVVYTWLLVFVALMIRLHARLAPATRRDAP